MSTKNILRYKDDVGRFKTPITEIEGDNGISVIRVKDATGEFDLDKVVIKNTSCDFAETLWFDKLLYIDEVF